MLKPFFPFGSGKWLKPKYQCCLFNDKISARTQIPVKFTQQPYPSIWNPIPISLETTVKEIEMRRYVLRKDGHKETAII